VYLLAAVLVTGQPQARLTGIVTDPSGLAVPAAEVRLTNTATGVVTASKANQAGIYAFPYLSPGGYDLNCEAPGFKTFARRAIVLETGYSRTVDVRLELGDTKEVLTVEAQTPLLESETSDVGQLIERASVFKMPLDSRRAGSLVRLVGGVTFTEEGGAAAQLPFFSMAGGRAREQNWSLDGLNNQNNTLGIGQMAMNPPSESLEEFKVEQNTYSAEMGRSGGGFIVMTTRSGTNALHGALYEFLRNDLLDARTFFAQDKAPLRYNIFGGSMGGPIVKNKTFYFFNYEGARQRIGNSYASDDVPHAADRTGDFSRRTDVAVIDPLTRRPFAGNVIPATRIDPIARQLAEYWPLPNRPDNDVTKAPRDNFLATASDKINQQYYVGRIDHSQASNDRFFFRFLKNDSDQTTPVSFPGKAALADPRGEHRDFVFHNFGGGWVHVFSPTVFNEFRMLYLDQDNDFRHVGAGSGIAGQVGLKGVNPDNFPRVTVTGLTSFGINRDTSLQGRKTYEFVNNVTWIRGRHQVKTGVNLRHSWAGENSMTASSGLFSFTDRATAEGLATFLLGWTTNGTLLTSDLGTIGDYWAGFVADDWKVTSRLTLNLGLRWELDTPPVREQDRLSGFDRREINPVSNTPGIVTFAPFRETGRAPFRSDRNNWSPRIGFAWRLSDGWVVRGGYGVFFNKPWRVASAAADVSFSNRVDASSPDGGFTPAFLWKDGMPPPPPPSSKGPGYGAVRVGEPPILSLTFFEQQVTGYNQQWNVAVQRLLGGGVLLETAYMANVGHKLYGNNLTQNMIPLVDGRGPAAQNQRLRPFPQFGDVTVLSPSLGNSTYHAFNFKVEKRYANGLSLLTNYTWSKFLDDISGQSELGSVLSSGYTHIELRKLDKSLSGNHIGQRMITSVVYDLPFGRGRRFDIPNRLFGFAAGGWSLAPIVEMRSGATYSVVEQTNRSNTFSHSQRPNLLGSPVLEGSRPRSELIAGWFNTTRFQAPGNGVFGNAPRTVCCGPGFFGFDLSAQKQFRITEQFSLLFRVDFFNLPNRPNFALPAALRGRADFGRISDVVGDGRQTQLGLRLEF
jgi:outer membrane receptor protein involved in Fe transport